MTPKERFITVLNRKKPDRLPFTTHHLMPSFLKNYMNGMSNQEFFDYFGIDPITWVVDHACSEELGEYFDPNHTEMGFLEARRVVSDNWKIQIEKLDGFDYTTQKFSILTPKKNLITFIAIKRAHYLAKRLSHQRENRY
jgi:uroporphyrinogen decarboxylase